MTYGVACTGLKTYLALHPAGDSGDADLDETMSTCSDGDGELDATLPYSLPYQDNDADDADDDNVGYRVQWEPPNEFETSESESELEDAELYTHKFIADKDPAPFSTSFVEYEGEEEEEAEGEDEDKRAPEGLRPDNLRVTFSNCVSWFFLILIT